MVLVVVVSAAVVVVAAAVVVVTGTVVVVAGVAVVGAEVVAGSAVSLQAPTDNARTTNTHDVRTASPPDRAKWP